MAARNKRKGWSASYNWVQQGINQYQIRLFGPLGGGTVIIAKQGGTVTYTDGPKKISSHNADQLLMQQTGIQLPVNNDSGLTYR
jgi:outer membrane lipoprotein LolB